MMKVLVTGQGGREHAIVRALKMSASVSEVHAIPGSDGISKEALCHDTDINDFASVLSLIRRTEIHLVVVGPEVHAASGLTNYLRDHGVLVFGPSQQSAQLETSKLFAKEFMKRASIPTAQYCLVSSVPEALEQATHFSPPYILKADGLAAGKGVFICSSLQELKEAATMLFEKGCLGESGKRALLEEALFGYETSLFVITNGSDYEILPLTQDHKRLLDGDKGPNTGGMGVVGPLRLSEMLRRQIELQIVQPTLKQLQREELPYRGVIYIGLMITTSGAKVLEYNVRFGDPECQVLLPLLDGDWGRAFEATAMGNSLPLKWKPLFCSCIVLASEGYPENPKKGVVIEGDPLYETPSSYFLHAGTHESSLGRWETAGGRVLNAIGIGGSLRESLAQGYAQARQVRWHCMLMREDIGSKVPHEELRQPTI